MKFTQGRTVLFFLDDISSWKCSWKCKSLQFERKKLDTKDSRIETQDPDGLVYYANHKTTEDLLDGSEIILVHMASTPTPKKEHNQFRTVHNPNQ